MSQSTDIYGTADYLDLKLATLRARIKAGTFPAPDATENGTDWWELSTLDKYVRAQRRKAKARTKR